MAEGPPDEARVLVGRLYDRHGTSLYRYAVMLLADPTAAEDAVQQVFAAMLRPSATRGLDNELHYLRRAVRNECFSMLRRSDLADRLRALVRTSSDALGLADEVSALTFYRFPPAIVPMHQTLELVSLTRLLGIRTLSLSLDNRGEEAVESAITALKVTRVLRDARSFSLWPWMTVREEQAAAVLSLSHPSDDALRRFQSALAADERPDQLVEDLLAERARSFEAVWHRYYGRDPNLPRQYALPRRSLPATVARPWLTHRVVGLLRIWTELVGAARRPWPDKIEAVTAAVAKYRAETRSPMLLAAWMSSALPLLPDAVVPRAVLPDTLVLDRSARTAVAVERFRRDHAGALPDTLDELVPESLTTVPADPMTGGPLLFRKDADAYRISSVGANQVDDDGDLSSELRAAIERGWGSRAVRGKDAGVRVLVRRQPPRSQLSVSARAAAR